jgi:lysophospholipase L1-like esterase
MKALRLLATAALVFSTAVEAQQKPAPPKKPLGAIVPAPARGLGLKDGDRFIFIGDSITHQCRYTQFVENFFYTRYPNLRLHFRNAGVSGDKAQDALNRFDEDIAAFKPTHATILLGMNDGTYKDFDLPTFQTYAKGMTELLDKLEALKVKIVIMSPTMFDHQAFEQMVAKNPDKGKNKTPTNYNGVLAYYGKWLQEVARARGHQFVDLFGPLNTLTVGQRKLNKDFTLIPDAIHPELDGSLIMAYSLLQQTGETGGILGTGVRLANGKWNPLSAQVTDIAGDPGRTASYTVAAKALPWAEFEDAPLGTRLARSGHTASQESHIVVGLQPGRYDLKINGQKVGTFDEKMLGVHAEIEEFKDSPTYQQAMKVIALNKKRNAEAVNPLRGLWGKQKGMFNKKDSDPAAYQAWQAEFKAKRAELDALAAKYEDEIYQINKVQPLKVEIVPNTEPVAKPQPKPAAKAPVKKAA